VAAKGVAFARLFDLDHIRTKIGEQHGCAWASDKGTEFEDTGAFKDACHTGLLLVVAQIPNPTPET
jgi:hypothetical protein